MEIKRIFDLLPNYLEKYPDQPVALAGKKDGEWRKYNMKEYIELTDKLSWALIELGIEVGDKVAFCPDSYCDIRTAAFVGLKPTSIPNSACVFPRNLRMRAIFFPSCLLSFFFMADSQAVYGLY